MNRSVLLRSVRTRAGPLATSAGRNRSPDRMIEAHPLLGFVTFCPSTDASVARPLPATRVAPRRLRADGTTRPASFRPRGFAPPRRLSPREGPRACCIPLPVLGFAAFRRNPLPTVTRASHRGGPTSCRGETGPAPRDASTLRRVPPARSRTVSPRPDPSLPSWHRRVVALPAPRCRSAEVARSDRAPRLRGVALRTGPLRQTPFRMPERSFLPWACVPFEVRLPPQHPGPCRGDPVGPEGSPSGRPSRRWRNTAVGPKTSLPCGSTEVAAGVCPEGSRAPPKRCRPPWGSRR